MIDLECYRRKLQVFSKASLTSEPKLCFEEVFFGSKAFNKMKISISWWKTKDEAWKVRQEEEKELECYDHFKNGHGIGAKGPKPAPRLLVSSGSGRCGTKCQCS